MGRSIWEVLGVGDGGARDPTHLSFLFSPPRSLCPSTLPRPAFLQNVLLANHSECLSHPPNPLRYFGKRFVRLGARGLNGLNEEVN